MAFYIWWIISKEELLADSVRLGVVGQKKDATEETFENAEKWVWTEWTQVLNSTICNILRREYIIYFDQGSMCR